MRWETDSFSSSTPHLVLLEFVVSYICKKPFPRLWLWNNSLHQAIIVSWDTCHDSGLTYMLNLLHRNWETLIIVVKRAVINYVHSLSSQKNYYSIFIYSIEYLYVCLGKGSFKQS